MPNKATKSTKPRQIAADPTAMPATDNAGSGVHNESFFQRKKTAILIISVIVLLSLISGLVGYMVSEGSFNEIFTNSSTESTRNQGQNEDKADAENGDSQHAANNESPERNNTDNASNTNRNTDNSNNANNQANNPSEGTQQAGPSSWVAYTLPNDMKQALWVVDTNGNNNRKIVDSVDGPIAWQNQTQISYSDCGTGGCAVKIYDVDTDSVVDQWDTPPFTQSIMTMQWNSDGTLLGVMLRNADDSTSVYSIEFPAKSQTLITQYAPAWGRGVSRSDNMEIEYSPAGGYMLVINTFANTDVDEISGVWGVDGVAGLSSEDAFMIDFDENGKLYTRDYIDGLDAWNLNIYNSDGAVMLDSEDYEPGDHEEVSPNGNYIVFDVAEGSPAVNKMYLHSVGDGASDWTALVNDHIQGEWLNDMQIVAVRTSHEAVDGMMGPIFTRQGLDVINVSDGSSRTIVNANDFGNFAIAPE